MESPCHMKKPHPWIHHICLLGHFLCTSWFVIFDYKTTTTTKNPECGSPTVGASLPIFKYKPLWATAHCTADSFCLRWLVQPSQNGAVKMTNFTFIENSLFCHPVEEKLWKPSKATREATAVMPLHISTVLVFKEPQDKRQPTQLWYECP